jgi:hypothetical protein
MIEFLRRVNWIPVLALVLGGLSLFVLFFGGTLEAGVLAGLSLSCSVLTKAAG